MNPIPKADSATEAETIHFSLQIVALGAGSSDFETQAGKLQVQRRNRLNQFHEPLEWNQATSSTNDDRVSGASEFGLHFGRRLDSRMHDTRSQRRKLKGCGMRDCDHRIRASYRNRNVECGDRFRNASVEMDHKTRVR